MKLRWVYRPPEKIPPKFFGEINMTRCIYLDSWFDAQSKRLDEEELKQKKDLITGERK